VAMIAATARTVVRREIDIMFMRSAPSYLTV
jgi:hypothetical protein